MDISFWTQCNPKISVGHTSKKYFGKYLYKLVVHSYCADVVNNDKFIFVEEFITYRTNLAKHAQNRFYWQKYNPESINTADPTFLNALRKVKKGYTNIRMRVEEPNVQIYAEDEDTLRDIVNNQFSADHYQYIEHIAGPKDDEAAELLNSGAIIKTSHNGYRYKIVMRDGNYGKETKRNILNYLVQLGSDEISISMGNLDLLGRASNYVWNLFFYCNDPHIADMINIINPGCVTNIHELVVRSNK